MRGSCHFVQFLNIINKYLSLHRKSIFGVMNHDSRITNHASRSMTGLGLACLFYYAMHILWLGWRAGLGGLVIFGMVMGMTRPVLGQWDTYTVNVTNLGQVNNPDLRGFDPGVVTGPTDPFTDTTRPCCLEGSTQFGNGLPSGNQKIEVNQNCNVLDVSGPPPSFSGSNNPFSVNVGDGQMIVQAGGHAGVIPAFTTNNCNAPLTGSVFHNDLPFQLSKNGLLSRRQSNTAACDTLASSPGGVANDRSCNEITFGFLQDLPNQGQLIDLSFSIRSLTDADGRLIGSAEGAFTQSITENGVTKACTGTFVYDEALGFVGTSGPLHEC